MNTQSTILILEDEQPLAAAIQTSLEAAGFSVVIARTFSQATDYLRSLSRIDAVWLDHYLLGRESGLDFLVQLRSDERGKTIPVFVVTNTGGYDKKQAYLQLGATQYFVKSDHTLREIIDSIREAILNHEAS